MRKTEQSQAAAEAQAVRLGLQRGVQRAVAGDDDDEGVRGDAEPSSKSWRAVDDETAWAEFVSLRNDHAFRFETLR